MEQIEGSLLEKLADPLDKSAVTVDGDRLVSSRSQYRLLSGSPVMMVEDPLIELHFGRRNFRAWHDLQRQAEQSYVTRTEGHFSVDSYQPALDFGAIVSLFSGEWLDVGCGKLKRPAYMAAAKNSSFFGIDPLSICVARDFPFVRALGDFLPFQQGAFDGVMFPSSLDHCISPLQALEEAYRVLKPGGTLLVWETIRLEDEHFASWTIAATYFLYRYNTHHNWAFSRKSLEQTVELAGFEVSQWEKTSAPTEAVLIGRKPIDERPRVR